MFVFYIFIESISILEGSETSLPEAGIVSQSGVDTQKLAELFDQLYVSEIENFKLNDDIHLVNEERQNITEDIILTCDKSFIDSCLSKISTNFDLITEFIILGLNLFANNPSPVFIDCILPSLRHFSELYQQNKENEIISYRYKCLLLFALAAICAESPDPEPHLYTSEAYNEIYILMLQQDNIRDSLLNKLVLKSMNVQNYNVLKFIKQICAATQNFNDSSITLSIGEVIRLLFNNKPGFIDAAHTIFKYFLPICEKTCNYEIACMLLSFLRYAITDIPDYVISDYENSIFSTIFPKYLNSNQIFTLFSSGSIPKDDYDKVTLKNASVIVLIFCFCSKTNTIDNFIEIINSIIHYCRNNVNKIIESGLCHIILRIAQNPEEIILYNGCEIYPIKKQTLKNGIFPMFFDITSENTSLQLAEEFIKLIIPEKLYPNYEETSTSFIEYLRTSSIIKFPVISPLKPKTHLIFEGAHYGDTIANGFGFSFWIKFDEPLSKYLSSLTFNLFELLVGNDQFLRVYFDKKAISVTVTQVTKISSFHILDNFDFGIWTYITLQFKKNEDKFKITCCIGKDKTSTSAIISEDLKNEEMKFIIRNESVTNLPDFVVENIVQMTNITFHQWAVPPGEHKLAEKVGLLNQFCKHKPFFCFPEYNTRHTNIMNMIYVDEELFKPKEKSLFVGVKNFPLERLSSLLNKSLKADNVLQIFCRFIEDIYDLKSENFDFILSLFGNYSFNVYKSLFRLSWIFDSNQAEAWFNSVLFNHALLVKNNNEQLEKILVFIHKKVLPQYIDFFSAKGFFRQLVTIIRAYYYYTGEGQEEVERYHGLDINKCLQIITALCVQLYQIIPDKDDGIICVLENAVSCKDSSLICFFLKLACQLFEFAPKSTEYVKYLHSVNFTQYRELLSPLLRAFYLCSAQNFYLRSQVLAYQLPISFSCEMFIDDVRQFPVLYTLATLISLKGDSEIRREISLIVNKLAKKIDTMRMIKGLEFWQLWPCIFALLSTGMEQTDMIYFIAKIITFEFNLIDLDQTLSLIDLLGLRMNIESQSVKSLLIKIIIDQLVMDQQEQQLLPDIWIRAIIAIFFQWRKNPLSETMRNSIANSPFADSVSSIIADKENRIKTYHDLKNMKFDPAKNYLAFVICNVDQMNQYSYNLLTSLFITQVTAMKRQLKYFNFVETLYKYVKEVNNETWEAMNSILLSSLPKIKEELVLLTTPEIQMTSMRLNSFVNGLGNQLHNVSKKHKMESDDLKQLYTKNSKSKINNEKMLLKNLHQSNDKEPQWVKRNYISSNFISNKLRRYEKQTEQTLIIRNSLPSLFTLKAKFYKDGNTCIECDGTLFENELLFESAKFKKSIMFDKIKMTFLSGRSGLSFIMNNGKMYLAVFEQEDLYDQMMTKIQIPIYKIGSEQFLDYANSINSCITMLTFYQFVNGSTFACNLNYPKYPLDKLENSKFENIQKYGKSSHEILVCPESISPDFDPLISFELRESMENSNNSAKIHEWIQNLMNHVVPAMSPKKLSEIGQTTMRYAKNCARAYYNPNSKTLLLIQDENRVFIGQMINTGIETTKIDNLSFPINSKVTVSGNSFIITNNEVLSQTIQPENTTTSISNVLSQVIFNDLKVEAFLDGRILISSENSVKTINFYSRVISISVDPDFDSLVISMTNRQLLFYNLSDSSLVNSVQSDSVYTHVLCMNSIGNVAAFKENQIDIFSVNGFLQFSINIDFSIKYWLSVQIRGMDRLFVVSDIGCVYDIHVKPNYVPEILYKSDSQIVDFKYDDSLVALCVLHHKEIVFIPIN